MNRLFSVALIALVGSISTGCITTSMQGYADRELPAKPIQNIVTLISAQPSLATSIQASVIAEARKRGVEAQDALLMFPPTRTYTDAEIKRDMLARGIDAVLVIAVGDSGVRKEYAGTIFQADYSGSTIGSGVATRSGNIANVSFNSTTTGAMTGTATPIHRYSRQTAFQARLIEPATARTLWLGNGQVQAGGLLFVGDGANAMSSVSAIFDDLVSKGVIRRPNA